MNTIAVDAMGGDAAPGPEVAGALAAVRGAPIEVVLVGDEARLEAELRKVGRRSGDHVRIHHAAEVVTMDDHPGKVFRQKRDSSLRAAIDLVASGEAAAVVSAGNSGATLSHALFVLGRLPEVERPGIVTVLPAQRGNLVLCDAGANVEIKPRMLAQFAILGACYDRIVHGHPRPRVGVLANGAERTKGTELTRAADDLLRTAAADPSVAFDYLGYVEGSDLWAGRVDVVATDGFTGNVVLKVAEGLSESLFRMVEGRLLASIRGRVGAALVRPALGDLQKRIDYAETGGALLAGVRGIVTICHGRSDVTAIKNAVKASDRFARADLSDRLGDAIARHHPVWATQSDEK